MTDKQIIIDGCDVSGCKYLYTDSKYNDKCCSASIGGNCLCKPSEMICIKYVECLKEQLKAKEQEHEKFKQTLIEIKDYCNEHPQNSIGFKKYIMQKISEVLNDRTKQS